MSKNRVVEINNQIGKLQKELEAITKEAKSVEFVKLLRAVLLDDKCSIILQGHEEWQFSERYRISDISYNIRKEIVDVLNKIETDKENEK